MKRFFVILWILVLLFSGLAYADNVNEESRSSQWTAIFTCKTSLKGSFGEIIILKESPDEGSKIYGTNIYVQDEIIQIEDKLFGAFYLSKRKPEKIIELVKKEEDLLVITGKEIKEILNMIRNDDRWIIMDDYKNGEESFKLLKTD